MNNLSNSTRANKLDLTIPDSTPAFLDAVLEPTALAECAAAGLLFTAIPKGTEWTVKVLVAKRETSRVGTYKRRSDAMLMASCLAKELGGRALA